jgi:hypothetical protein
MDRPIIFSAPMVRALLAGRKTQTRRVLKPQPEATWSLDPARWHAARVGRFWFTDNPDQPGNHCISARYAPGDRLYVRETWRTDASMDALKPKNIEAACLEAGYQRAWAPIQYEADGARDNFTESYQKPGKTRVAIHMPRWASRLTLIVEAVKVERLTDVSEADAQAEGVEPVLGTPGVPLDRHYAAFMQLWDSLHGEGATYATPWVVAVTFRVVRANIDAVAP